jgi:hypothetical protein
MTALLLVVNTTEGVIDASALGASTVTRDDVFSDINKNGPRENPQTKPPAEGDRNDRVLSWTTKEERPVHDKESNSEEAPICKEATGNKFEMGTPNELPLPSPKLKYPL